MYLSMQDFLDTATKSPVYTTDYVVIDTSVASDGLILAQAGNFLYRLSSDYYRCKRSIAEQLELSIISDYPMQLF